MHATRAAVEEGIVPGGGVALARSVGALDKLRVEGDEQIGVNIVKKALQEPLRQIAENSDRKSTRLNSSHLGISYAVFCLKKKKKKEKTPTPKQEKSRRKTTKNRTIQQHTK